MIEGDTHVTTIEEVVLIETSPSLVQYEASNSTAVSWYKKRLLIHAFGSWVRATYLLENVVVLSLEDAEGRVRALRALQSFRRRQMSSIRQRRQVVYAYYVHSYTLVYSYLLRMQEYVEQQKRQRARFLSSAPSASKAIRLKLLQRAMSRVIRKTMSRKLVIFSRKNLHLAWAAFRLRQGIVRCQRQTYYEAIVKSDNISLKQTYFRLCRWFKKRRDVLRSQLMASKQHELVKALHAINHFALFASDRREKRRGFLLCMELAHYRLGSIRRRAFFARLRLARLANVSLHSRLTSADSFRRFTMRENGMDTMRLYFFTTSNRKRKFVTAVILFRMLALRRGLACWAMYCRLHYRHVIHRKQANWLLESSMFKQGMYRLKSIVAFALRDSICFYRAIHSWRIRRMISGLKGLLGYMKLSIERRKTSRDVQIQLDAKLAKVSGRRFVDASSDSVQNSQEAKLPISSFISQVKRRIATKNIESLQSTKPVVYMRKETLGVFGGQLESFSLGQIGASQRPPETVILATAKPRNNLADICNQLLLDLRPRRAGCSLKKE